jgi:cell shape-determining protein MreC
MRIDREALPTRMSFLRFNHVFAALMILSILTGFVLDPADTEPARGQLQGLFYPVSRPARRIAFWVYSHFVHDDIPDARSDATIRQENDLLRQDVANLFYQLTQLQELNSDRASLGKLRQLCTAVPVIGDDSGPADSLLLKASSLAGLRNRMAVLYRGGLAGRLESVGVGGARVRLLTDAGFRVTGNFIRFQNDSHGNLTAYKIQCDDPLIEGLGDGKMVIRNLTLRQVQDAKIAAGDWVVLEDSDWEMEVQGERIGQVEAAPVERRDAPMFAEIHVRPMTGMSRLMEVMVLTHSAGAADVKG